MFTPQPNEPNFKSGSLPSEAPLATAWVPNQRAATPNYEPEQALIRGTLFPGLDLPFKNIANVTMPDTPVGELMALDFIIHELTLYLDTHETDLEALALFQNFSALAEEHRKRFTALYGPLRTSDVATADSYSWLNSPWPWEYSERMGNL